MLLKLLVPFDYLRISHPDKRKIDIYAPAVLSILTVGLGYFFVPDLRMSGPDGVYDRFLTFTPTLLGFYIAALAAVATFNKPDMDDPLPGSPIFLSSIGSSELDGVEQLTRRRLLCLQFGYLCALSLVIVVISFVGMFVGEKIKNTTIISEIGIYLFVSVYSFIIYNLFTSTMFSIYYLVDRMHRRPLEIKGMYNKPPDGV